MLWSTGSVAPGVNEHRRTTRLMHFRHRSFRSGRRRWYCRTLFKKDMGPKGENKHPAKILPTDHKHNMGKRYPAHKKPQPGPDGKKYKKVRAGTSDSISRFRRYHCSTLMKYNSNLSMCCNFFKKMLPLPDNRKLLSTPRRTYDLNFSTVTLRIW